MHHYRLTFDPNPKELATRDAGIGSRVALLWSRRTGRAAVVLEDAATGELVEIEVEARENPSSSTGTPTSTSPPAGTRAGARATTAHRGRGVVPCRAEPMHPAALAAVTTETRGGELDGEEG